MGCGCNQQTTTTTCNDCCTNTDPCVTQPCGCEVELNAACVRYTGEDIPCIDVSTGDTMETALQSIGEKICSFSGSYVTVVNEPAGVNCENGGVLISIFDSESDALIENSYICIPSTNSITVVAEAPGVNCSEGGVAVNTYDAEGVLEDTIYICTPVCECAAKENFYAEAIADVNLSDDPAFSNLVYFQPTGYTTLTYTNTSGAAKDYIVHASYDTNLPDISIAESAIKNHVDGALIKTVSAVDTVLYESIGESNIVLSLYDSLANEIGTGSLAPNQVLTTAGNPVGVLIKEGTFPRNVSFFKKVTLNNNESVSLKFRCRNSEQSLIQKAQIFVNEID